MRLIPELSVSPTIQVRDRNGQVWEVTAEDARPWYYDLLDDQGPPVRNVALAAKTPQGEVLCLPPHEKWRTGRVYDGVLTHPACGIAWRHPVT